MADGMTPLVITRVSQETPQMRLFTLGTEKPWTFIPGQVAILSPDGQAQSYIAVASAPEHTGGLEVLIKDGAGTANLLYARNTGATVMIKGPVGKGFPVDNYKNRDLILTAVGSAISPMRSVLSSLTYRRNDFGKVTFVCGVRNPEDLPFRKEMDAWRKVEINVIPTTSRPSPGWTGKTGYVHTHFGEVLASLNKPVALICGMKAMMEQSRAELVKLGVAAEEVLTNY